MLQPSPNEATSAEHAENTIWSAVALCGEGGAQEIFPVVADDNKDDWQGQQRVISDDSPAVYEVNMGLP